MKNFENIAEYIQFWDKKMYAKYKRHLPRSYVMGTLIRRREDPEYATEMLNEIGTTDMAIGDATAEIMITTVGKIPDEMYELDETRTDSIDIAEENHGTDADSRDKSTDDVSGFVAHSTLFAVLLIALLLLVLICCLSACIIARARKQRANSSDECDPDCGGARQPLMSSDKMSETTSKSSASSTRH